MRSKTLRTRLVKTARTESRAETIVAKIERRTSKMEEMRFDMEEVRDDMIVAVLGVGWLFGWLILVEERLGLECGSKWEDVEGFFRSNEECL